MPIINGRWQQPGGVPDSGVYGREILSEARPDPGRRIAIMRGTTDFETIQPDKRYSKRELLDKKGNPVKIANIPDRTKGTSRAEAPILSRESRNV